MNTWQNFFFFNDKIDQQNFNSIWRESLQLISHYFQYLFIFLHFTIPFLSSHSYSSHFDETVSSINGTHSRIFVSSEIDDWPSRKNSDGPGSAPFHLSRNISYSNAIPKSVRADIGLVVFRF